MKTVGDHTPWSDDRLPDLISPVGLVSREELHRVAVAVGLPMRTRFRGLTVREAMLIKGPRGWAEFSPFAEYGPVESSRWLSATLEAGWLGFPTPRRSTVLVNATVPAIAADQVETVLRGFTTDGDLSSLSAVKIKIAEKLPADPAQLDRHIHGVQADYERVMRVRELLPEAQIKVDANQALTVDEAVHLLGVLQEAGLEYAEQPVPGLTAMAELRSRLARNGIDLPLAADESIRKAEDPFAVVATEAADIAVVKVQPLGGIRRALAVVEATGLQAVVSSALDTSVGMSAGLALAGALPELHYACGLGTVALFSEDVCSPRLIPEHGELTVPASHSEVPEPDPDKLARFRLPEDRQQVWHQRLEEAYSVLAG
ncbi:o-succinylbenzoate synthase [Auritidibacter ignavus]|uniref:o-succinylbenzoate synthase n=1 Tax=Auritidibacter ignavus TaxID=678932 RepID=UPI0024B8944E|nr:o-succinylbenzoate synthase [Auritidibacter ignavus]WHS28586.1 o-succinylbenzoate synthase [Auritidibacter ignavus]